MQVPAGAPALLEAPAELGFADAVILLGRGKDLAGTFGTGVHARRGEEGLFLVQKWLQMCSYDKIVCHRYTHCSVKLFLCI